MGAGGHLGTTRACPRLNRATGTAKGKGSLVQVFLATGGTPVQQLAPPQYNRTANTRGGVVGCVCVCPREAGICPNAGTLAWASRVFMAIATYSGPAATKKHTHTHTHLFQVQNGSLVQDGWRWGGRGDRWRVPKHTAQKPGPRAGGHPRPHHLVHPGSHPAEAQGERGWRGMVLVQGVPLMPPGGPLAVQDQAGWVPGGLHHPDVHPRAGGHGAGGRGGRGGNGRGPGPTTSWAGGAHGHQVQEVRAGAGNGCQGQVPLHSPGQRQGLCIGRGRVWASTHTTSTH